MIRLAVPAFSRYDLLAQLIGAALTSTVVPDEILVVDNGCAFEQKYRGPRERVQVFAPGRNLGVAAAWNHAIRTATPGDTVVVSNDDFTPAANSIEQMSKALASLDARTGVVLGQHSGYGFFAIDPVTFARVGPFDEEFWPAYYEDNDYAYRLKLLGVPMVHVPIEGEHVGSATIKAMSPEERQAHHARFRALSARYAAKWGGMPGRETRKWPIDLDQAYERATKTRTDIFEHLPLLRTLGGLESVEHVVEFGVRTGVSTLAWLMAQPSKLDCYDISPFKGEDAYRMMCGQTRFQFTQADVLTIPPVSCDVLFIDTLHTYDQLSAELARHAGGVRQHIVLHDTATFGEQGEIKGARGLWPAVEEFTARGTFRITERRTNDNGLTVLTRAKND